jgi:DNA-binding NarL/FixJ family response regulator
MRPALKFLVVDDHALTRAGVRLALSEIAESVAVVEAASAETARAAINGNPDFDLVLLDLGLPRAGGLSLLRDLRRDQNIVPVVVVSGTEERSYVLKALDLGALGYIPKSAPVGVMLQAVRLVLAGGMYIPPEALMAVRQNQGEGAGEGSRIQDLTDRQREILRLMAHGKPNKLIGADLSIAEATVKAHVTEILRVLKVTNRTQAVIVAGDLGLE